jgi:uncharacterized MAPEG superfamily protein
MLLAGVGLLMAGTVFQAFAGLFAYGAPAQLGPRDGPREITRMVGRGERAVRNHIESLLMFGPAVLIAHSAGVSTELTVFGAQLWAVARALYLPLYWFGVPLARTFAFMAGLVGIGLVVAPVVLRLIEG